MIYGERESLITCTISFVYLRVIRNSLGYTAVKATSNFMALIVANAPCPRPQLWPRFLVPCALPWMLIQQPAFGSQSVSGRGETCGNQQSPLTVLAESDYISSLKSHMTRLMAMNTRKCYAAAGRGN